MKLVSNHFKYASNVWLTSAILTPCIYGLMMIFTDEISFDIPIVILVSIFFGILFSLPNYYFLFYCVWQINRTKLDFFEKKIIINLIAIALTFSLFFLIFRNDLEDGFFIELPFAYSATLTFGVWFFNLYRPALGSSEKVILPKIKMLEDILDDEIY